MNHTKPTSNTKTHRSVNNYINSLHDQYSKILAIRVDLGYLKEHSEQALLSDIKKDVKKLLDNRRGKPSIFQDQVGYVVKYESAPAKGPHAHALFLYDGQHVQKDAYIGIDFLEKKTEIIKLKQPEDENVFSFDIDTPNGKKTIAIATPSIEPLNAIKLELTSFVDAILNNKPTQVNEIDGYLAMEVAHQILDKINNTSILV